jgi:hypothetical protein
VDTGRIVKGTVTAMQGFVPLHQSISIALHLKNAIGQSSSSPSTSISSPPGSATWTLNAITCVSKTSVTFLLWRSASAEGGRPQSFCKVGFRRADGRSAGHVPPQHATGLHHFFAVNSHSKSSRNLEKNAAESPFATEYAINRKTMARTRGPDPLSLSELVV